MNDEYVMEKQSSVEVSRNGKGEYSWKIKVYFDDEKKERDDLLDYIEDLNTKIKQRFLG